ncbi:hypothetical protein MBLNU457_5250t1 [Dothideomycetes sp. NU457]
MSDSSKNEKPSGAESPTTAKQLDFDDEPQDAASAKDPTHPVNKPDSAATMSDTLKPNAHEEEQAPAKPPRPLTPQQQSIQTLKEAFPDIDTTVIGAVLQASGGNIEPAFNALLGMSDPSFSAEEAPPPQPPRPTAAQRQLEQDEMYARQLAQHYQARERPQRGAQRPEQTQRRQQCDDDELYGSGDRDRDRNFFDDDLNEFGETVRKGFVETQAKFTQWFGDIRKRLEGDDDDPLNGPPRQDTPPRRQNFGSSQSAQLRGIRQSAERSRRSGDAERYDADPHVLGDDFTALELKDEEAPPPKPSRPMANPNLFKATPAPPQSGPVDEVDAFDRKAAGQESAAPNSASKNTKWQPLTSMAPNPEAEENDPFSLGDSDDEKESKTKDINEAASTRLKDAARQSVSNGKKPEGLQERETGSTGTKDKDAEALLTGDKPSSS